MSTGAFTYKDSLITYALLWSDHNLPTQSHFPACLLSSTPRIPVTDDTAPITNLHTPWTSVFVHSTSQVREYSITPGSSTARTSDIPLFICLYIISDAVRQTPLHSDSLPFSHWILMQNWELLFDFQPPFWTMIFNPRNLWRCKCFVYNYQMDVGWYCLACLRIIAGHPEPIIRRLIFSTTDLKGIQWGRSSSGSQLISPSCLLLMPPQIPKDCVHESHSFLRVTCPIKS